jgi:PTH1 family peptidyl-tRNA hydrolase
MIKLVIGLGNPGAEYELTRHNIGWLVLDSIDLIASSNWKSKFKGEFTDLSINGEKRYFLKPQTYMNLSGESARPLCDFFKIKPSEMLVLHDELDVPFGQIAFKKGGGLAGHNGLKSLAQHFGTQDFYRLRLGIGRPDRGSVSNWVLGQFPSNQDIELGKILKGSAEAVEFALKSGYEKAATKFSKKNFLKDN